MLSNHKLIRMRKLQKRQSVDFILHVNYVYDVSNY
jgi:hypothetical protein